VGLSELPPSGHQRTRGLVSRRSGVGVEARIYAPPEDLADVVESFWVGRWNLPEGEPHVTELLGDPCVHVAAEHAATRVVGVWTRRWIRRLEGRGLVRAAKLRAGAVRAFFDVSASDLTNQLTPAEELDPRLDGHFERRLLEPESDEVAFAHLAQTLRELRRRDDSVKLGVIAATHLGHSDLQNVESLAARLEVGVRSLQRLFKRHVGAPPKLLLQRARVQEAALRIERGEAPNLAALAADLGYADQAHLTRDFKVAVGATPRELEARLR